MRVSVIVLVAGLVWATGGFGCQSTGQIQGEQSTPENRESEMEQPNFEDVDFVYELESDETLIEFIGGIAESLELEEAEECLLVWGEYAGVEEPDRRAGLVLGTDSLEVDVLCGEATEEYLESVKKGGEVRDLMMLMPGDGTWSGGHPSGPGTRGEVDPSELPTDSDRPVLILIHPTAQTAMTADQFFPVFADDLVKLPSVNALPVEVIENSDGD